MNMTIKTIAGSIQLDSPTLYTYLFDATTNELLFEGTLGELMDDGKAYMIFASMRIGYDHDRQQPVFIIKGR